MVVGDWVGLSDVIKIVLFIILFGCLMVYGVFIKEVVEVMMVFCKYLMIFLLFNLMLCMEVIFVDVLVWLNGRVLFVIGSLVVLVEFDEIIYVIG